MNEEELKISKAYQALNQEEPLGSPPELDAAILAQAHKAVQAKPEPINARSHLTLRWGAPMASAALVVLSVTVFIIMPELEQQQAMQLDGHNVETDFYSEAIPQLIEVKEQRAKQERKVSQRIEAKAMKKLSPVAEPVSVESSPAPIAPMTSGMSAQRTFAPQNFTMDSVEEEMLSDMAELEALPTADKWVETIKQLIDQKEWNAADEQFQAFAKHYPDHEFNKKYGKLKQK